MVRSVSSRAASGSRAKFSVLRSSSVATWPASVAATSLTRRSCGSASRVTNPRVSSRSTMPVMFDGSQLMVWAMCRIGIGPRRSSASTLAWAPVSERAAAASSYSRWKRATRPAIRSTTSRVRSSADAGTGSFDMPPAYLNI